MTDNQQRAATTVAAWTTGSKPWSALSNFVAAALDAAEQRGRDEVAQQLRDRHTRDGYGLCRECTTYGDDARDILQPVTWPCATRHSLAAGAS